MVDVTWDLDDYNLFDSSKARFVDLLLDFLFFPLKIGKLKDISM